VSDVLHPEQSSAVSLVERLPAADFPLRLVDVVLLSSLRDRKSDRAELEDALCEALGAADIDMPISVVRDLGETFRAADGKVMVTVRSMSGIGERWEVTRVRPSADAVPWYVAVLDLGHETVWGQLLDGETGRVVVTAAAASAREALDKMGGRCGAAEGSVEHVVVAGGASTVLGFLGPDALPRAVDPHVSPWAGLGPAPASALQLGALVSPRAVVKALPAATDRLGGDIVGGLLVSGVTNGEGVSLYVDVGPAGAVVVGNREWLVAMAFDAGSVFEGGGLSHGMAAVPGAIERVTIDPVTLRATVTTIDEAAPRGISGSGVIDAVAELLKAGIVLPDGRFDPSCGSPDLHREDGRPEYVLVPAGSSATGSEMVLTESDVQSVMRAAMAMSAGMTALLESVSVEWAGLQKIVIGAASGKILRVRQLMAIGLFPQLDADRFEFAGNGSLLGARAVATSRRLEGRANQIASGMRKAGVSGGSVSGRG
jgi:uncharacterized 2Fe-2S/4Fe-4S cluster protein (DUF4445 family)